MNSVQFRYQQQHLQPNNYVSFKQRTVTKSLVNNGKKIFPILTASFLTVLGIKVHNKNNETKIEAAKSTSTEKDADKPLVKTTEEIKAEKVETWEELFEKAKEVANMKFEKIKLEAEKKYNEIKKDAKEEFAETKNLAQKEYDENYKALCIEAVGKECDNLDSVAYKQYYDANQEDYQKYTKITKQAYQEYREATSKAYKQFNDATTKAYRQYSNNTISRAEYNVIYQDENSKKEEIYKKEYEKYDKINKTADAEYRKVSAENERKYRYITGKKEQISKTLEQTIKDAELKYESTVSKARQEYDATVNRAKQKRNEFLAEYKKMQESRNGKLNTPTTVGIGIKQLNKEAEHNIRMNKKIEAAKKAEIERRKAQEKIRMEQITKELAEKGITNVRTFSGDLVFFDYDGVEYSISSKSSSHINLYKYIPNTFENIPMPDDISVTVSCNINKCTESKYLMDLKETNPDKFISLLTAEKLFKSSTESNKFLFEHAKEEYIKLSKNKIQNVIDEVESTAKTAKRDAEYYKERARGYFPLAYASDCVPICIKTQNILNKKNEELKENFEIALQLKDNKILSEVLEEANVLKEQLNVAKQSLYYLKEIMNLKTGEYFYPPSSKESDCYLALYELQKLNNAIMHNYIKQAEKSLDYLKMTIKSAKEHYDMNPNPANISDYIDPRDEASYRSYLAHRTTFEGGN